MIDRIVVTLSLSGGEVLRPEDFQNVYRVRYFGTGQWEGKIKGLPIELRVERDSLRVTANLPKLIQKQNVSPLNRHQIKMATELLSGYLETNLDRATVRSLEIGSTIIVKEFPARYFRLFGCHATLTRNSYVQAGKNTGVSYTSRYGFWAFKFYDKTAEVRSKRKPMPIPPLFQGENLLRLELKVKRKGIQTCTGGDIFLENLHDPDTYGKLKNFFYEKYQQIPKVGRDFYLDGGEGKRMTYKDLISLFCKSYGDLYPDEVADFLVTLRSRELLSKRDYRNFRKFINSDTVGRVRSTPDDLIREIDGRVSDWVQTG